MPIIPPVEVLRAFVETVGLTEEEEVMTQTVRWLQEGFGDGFVPPATDDLTVVVASGAPEGPPLAALMLIGVTLEDTALRHRIALSQISSGWQYLLGRPTRVAEEKSAERVFTPSPEEAHMS